MNNFSGVIETLDDQLDRLESTNSDLEDTKENLEEENKIAKGKLKSLTSLYF